MSWRCLIAAASILSILASGAVQAATVTKGAGKAKPVSGPTPPGKAPRFVEGQVLVGFSPGAGAQERSDAHAQAGGRLIRRLPQLDVEVVSVPSGAVFSSIAAYRRNPNVRFAEPNYLRRLTLPNEGSEPWPYGGGTIDFMTEQWGLHNTGQGLYYDQLTGELGAIRGTPDADIDFDEAWNHLNGRAVDQAIVIAVLDSGVACSHEDLNAKCVNQQLFAPSAYGQADFIGHGTHVAAIAAATTNNSRGIAGVGWNARIADLKVCYEEIDWLFGFVYGICADADIAAGLTYAADQRYHVANMSLAGPEESSTLAGAVAYAAANGMLVVAGAGNAYTQDTMYPAGYPSVIAVGATDYFDNLAGFSSFGKTWVHLLAPGVNILSALSPEACEGIANCYGWNSGTSMATPHVAGAAALVWGYRKALGLPATNTAVYDILLSSAEATGALGQNFLAWVTRGRLNLHNAVILAESGTPPPPPPGATAVHVADLEGSSVNQGGTWSARVTVAVHSDASHAAVSGATVSGTWSGGTSGSGSCTTASGGTCVITSGNIQKKATSATFTVTTVTGNNLSYSSGSNHDADGDSNGTTISVAKP